MYYQVINIDLLFCLFFIEPIYLWKSWKRSCSWTAPLTWTSSLPTPLMKSWQGLPLGLGTKRPSRIWVEDKNTHTCMHIRSGTYVYASLMWQPRSFGRSNGLFNVPFSSILAHLCSSVCPTSSAFLYVIQVGLCWILPSTARSVTPTPWSTRSVTVSAFTTFFGAYRRSSRATMCVWRPSPRWKLEICARTPTPPPNTKAAMIPTQATKPVGAGTSHTHPSTTTWVMQVSHEQEVDASPFESKPNLNHLCHPQTTPAPIPSPWTR